MTIFAVIDYNGNLYSHLSGSELVFWKNKEEPEKYYPKEQGFKVVPIKVKF